MVKWNCAYSSPFPVISGVRQVLGVLSAKFWAIYMDDLVFELKATKCGCYIADLFVACILYADDVCLLAPTRGALQTLLNICSSYAKTWCIKYNERKTKVMYFGKDFKTFTCHPLTLNGGDLEVVNEWKYLGVTIVSDRSFSCSAQKYLQTFYRSANSVLNVIRKPSEQVMMNLLYCICVPCLTYASDAIDFSSRDMNRLHVATNDAIRRIFTYARWESVTTLRQCFGYKSITEIFAMRKRTFHEKLPHIGNDLVSTLAKLS